MRKKTIKFGLDNIFWYIIYLLPIIITVCLCLGAFQGNWTSDWDGDTTTMPFSLIFGNVMYDFEVYEVGVLGTALKSIFADFQMLNQQDGVLPLFSEFSPIFDYLVYFIGCVLIHLFVDFILFIPRLCHKWMSSFTKTED